MLIMSNIDKQTSIINAFSGINKPEGATGGSYSRTSASTGKLKVVKRNLEP